MRRSGHTLFELMLVMLLLGILLSMGMPQVRKWRDAAAVAAARDELAGRLAWTRIAAVSAGGAQLVLEVPSGRYRVETADGTLAIASDLSGRYGVAVTTVGAVDSVVLRFDGLGIGRMTGRTLEVRRGAATAGLTITPFGRYRRW